MATETITDWNDPKPREVSDTDVAIGAVNLGHLMPSRDFLNGTGFDRHSGTRWNRIFTEWFHKGLKDVEFIPKKGIDQDKALRHIAAIMRSWEPKHEHKEAAVAYLLSKWFEDVKVPGKDWDKRGF